ncbi:MAG: hypothetical protein ACE5HD_05450 [Acidobacteriota bacterium]
MNCKTARAELTAHRLCDLSPAASRALRSHLAACRACDQEREILARMLRSITADIVFPGEKDVDWSLPVTCWFARAGLASILRSFDPDVDRDEILAHLSRCPSCADESASISATVTAARGAFPEEETVHWAAFAKETTRLAMSPRPLAAASWTSWMHLPPGSLRRLAPLAAVLALAAGLFYLSFRMPSSGPAPSSARLQVPSARRASDLPVVPRDLVRRTRIELAKSQAARYLNESRSVLLSFSELSVPCREQNVDVSAERTVSTRLLRRKQFLDRDLEDVAIVRVRRLANEVGDLLSAIASLENCTPPGSINEIRNQVEQHQLMMRIEMLTDELGLPRDGRA